ncbi:MAG: hypothetical protein HYY84_08915 [Deltaproteobacteria bacterium]|nr:hypothetical protein [Deltaproteobacteria bacterium]
MGMIFGRLASLLAVALALSPPAFAADISAGKYRGSVGATAVIAFDVASGAVTNIHAGIMAMCQNTRARLTRKHVIAIRLGKKRVKISAGRAFAVKGRSDKNTSYILKGKFGASGKASGTFQASRIIFSPATYSSELCQSRFPWKATLQ